MNIEGGNRGNGFKLGGEGLPVGHVVRNSLAFNNYMDGFTDNFNPGPLRLEDNVALDNTRFNFIVRQNPYGDAIKSASLQGNQSLRIQRKGQYDDSVNGQVAAQNWFLTAGQYGPSTQQPPAQSLLAQASSLLQQPADDEKAAREQALALQKLFFPALQTAQASH